MSPGLCADDMHGRPKLVVERAPVRRPGSLELRDELVLQREPPNFPIFFDEHAHVFTDGSTNAAQSVPISAWSVVLADPDRFDDASVIATWMLHGCQDNYREEMTVAWVAIQHCRSASVYIDNIAVVRGLLRLQTTGWQPAYWDRHKEATLWMEIWKVLQRRDVARWRFTHVRSHREVGMQKDFYSAWTASGNNAADVAAKKPFLELAEDVRNVYTRACSDFSAQAGRMHASLHCKYGFSSILGRRRLWWRATSRRPNRMSPTCRYRGL